MKRMLKDAKPDRFEDIIALVALCSGPGRCIGHGPG